MSIASRRPYGPAFPVRGVFPADPHNPPVPPPGAIATEIVDHTGRIICYAWVVKEHADAAATEIQWEYLDSRDPISASGASSGPRLMK
jgi:hypothetical protein